MLHLGTILFLLLLEFYFCTNAINISNHIQSDGSVLWSAAWFSAALGVTLPLEELFTAKCLWAGQNGEAAALLPYSSAQRCGVPLSRRGWCVNQGNYRLQSATGCLCVGSIYY